MHIDAPTLIAGQNKNACTLRWCASIISVCTPGGTMHYHTMTRCQVLWVGCWMTFCPLWECNNYKILQHVGLYLLFDCVWHTTSWYCRGPYRTPLCTSFGSNDPSSTAVHTCWATCSNKCWMLYVVRAEHSRYSSSYFIHSDCICSYDTHLWYVKSILFPTNMYILLDEPYWYTSSNHFCILVNVCMRVTSNIKKTMSR